MYQRVDFEQSADYQNACSLLNEIVDKKAVNPLRKVDKPLALYGAGNLGEMACDYITLLGMELAFIVDKNAQNIRVNSPTPETPILLPEEVSEEQKKRTLLVTCVTTFPHAPIYNDLRAQGWDDVVPFYDLMQAYRGKHPLNNGWFIEQFSSLQITETKSVLARWSDDVSRAHHLCFLAWRKLREEWHFKDAPFNSANRFFTESVLARLTSHERFLDIGAHKGSVTEDFLRHTKGKFSKIWLVEPDLRNLRDLNDFVSKQEVSTQGKVSIIDKCLSHEERPLNFFPNVGYASQICDFGTREVVSCRLDSLNLDPTLIKLHLEGWELDVLKGAKDTLAKNRPMIMATAYHNELGIYELAKWMMDNLANYTFKLRQHYWCGTGLVVYAYPD